MPIIVIDPVGLIAYAKVSGFVDSAAMLRITADIDRAIEAFGDRMPLHGRLIDLTEAKVAPPAAIAALCEMTIDPARAHLRANRMAYFGASPLVQQQVRRLCALGSRFGMFDDRQRAFAWATGGRSSPHPGAARH